MKKYLILLASILVFQNSNAQVDSQSLDDIITQQSQVNQINYSDSHYKQIWGKKVYLNVGLDNTKMSMKDVDDSKQSSKFSLGLNWGESFNINKRPFGNVLFVGIDYTWIDFHYANYDSCDKWADNRATGEKPYPWGNKMDVLDYGMSVGPQITLYPFTSLHKKGLDPIRFQAYFHVGYDVKFALLKNVTKTTGAELDHSYDADAWGHGLYTEFGFNLDWNFIGIGYASRTDNSIRFKAMGYFDTSVTKFNQSENRIYLQFRF